MSAFVPNFDFIFTIARMNPPTPGHKELVKQMMITALANGNKPVYIGLSTTCCKEDNPLTCGEKKELVEAMIANIIEENAELQEVIATVICADDNVGNKMIGNVTSKIITNFNISNKPNGLMFFGDDYKVESHGIINCNKTTEKINYCNLNYLFDNLYIFPPLVRKINSPKSLQLTDGTEIPLPSAGMSATFIRNLTLNDEDEFNKKITEHYEDKDPEVLRLNQKEIFNKIMSDVTSDIETRIISNEKTLFDLIQERYSTAQSDSIKTKQTAAKRRAISAVEGMKKSKSVKNYAGGKKPRITKCHLKKTTKRKTTVRFRK